jgi:hypothetical protein
MGFMEPTQSINEILESAGEFFAAVAGSGRAVFGSFIGEWELYTKAQKFHIRIHCIQCVER